MIWKERVKFHSNDTLDACENAMNAMQSEHQNIHTHTHPATAPTKCAIQCRCRVKEMNMNCSQLNMYDFS